MKNQIRPGFEKVDVIQFRNLIKKHFCKTFERFCFVIINGKKKLIRPEHEWGEFFDLSNRFPDNQKKTKFQTTAFASPAFIGIPVV